MRALIWGRGLIVVVLLGTAACAWFRHQDPTDPSSPPTFVAHAETGGLIIDKMGSGETGRVVPSGSGAFAAGPQLLVETSAGPTAALWIRDPDIVIRQAGDPAAPPIGQVESSWDNGAIRLTLIAEGDGTYHTTSFDRVSGGTAPTALGQPANLTFDLRGEYVAVVSDAQGAPAGWLRVSITGVLGPRRTYEGVLPETVNGPVAVAAVARLEREFKGARADAVNPYIGN